MMMVGGHSRQQNSNNDRDDGHNNSRNAFYCSLQSLRCYYCVIACRSLCFAHIMLTLLVCLFLEKPCQQATGSSRPFFRSPLNNSCRSFSYSSVSYSYFVALTPSHVSAIGRVLTSVHTARHLQDWLPELSDLVQFYLYFHYSDKVRT